MYVNFFPEAGVLSQAIPPLKPTGQHGHRRSEAVKSIHHEVSLMVKAGYPFILFTLCRGKGRGLSLVHKKPESPGKNRKDNFTLLLLLFPSTAFPPQKIAAYSVIRGFVLEKLFGDFAPVPVRKIPM